MVAYTHYHTDARPRRTAEALAARGDHVDFLSLEADTPTGPELIQGVHLSPLSLGRYRGGAKGQYLKSYIQFWFKALLQVTRNHIRERYDVIYFHTMPDFIVFAGALAKLSGAKIILDVHDMMPELYQSKFGIDDQHPLVRVLKLQEKLSCRFADHVVCVHEPHRALLASRGCVRKGISVLLNLPDPAVFDGEDEHSGDEGQIKNPRLVYHGTVASRLGLDVAVRALVRVREKFPGATFDIYGSGDAIDDVRAAVVETQQQDVVQVTGEFFPVGDIPKMLRGASLGVIPNRLDVATDMMLPVKLLEYLYLGIPVVAPGLKAIRHYFSDDAVAYYEPGNEVALANAIIQVLSERERRETQRVQAQAFYAEHSWEYAKERLFQAVDSL
jgi:glycosyltransferase involved in cell wall biosynthesis